MFCLILVGDWILTQNPQSTTSHSHIHPYHMLFCDYLSPFNLYLTKINHCFLLFFIHILFLYHHIPCISLWMVESNKQFKFQTLIFFIKHERTSPFSFFWVCFLLQFFQRNIVLSLTLHRPLGQFPLNPKIGPNQQFCFVFFISCLIKLFCSWDNGSLCKLFSL